MARQKKQSNKGQQTLESALHEAMPSIPNNVKYIALWIVALVALFLVLSYLFPFIFKMLGVGTVTYDGLTFTKEVIGTKPNQIQVYHYYYLYKDKKGQIVQNNIYLRTNPAQNTVPFTGTITFVENEPVYLGLDTDNLIFCNQSSIAIGTLSGFIKNAELNITGGTLNKSEAKDKNVSYVSCSAQKTGEVIEIVVGNETKITQNNQCYKISAATCQDVLPAVEKFIMRAIIDAKNRNETSKISG